MSCFTLVSLVILGMMIDIAFYMGSVEAATIPTTKLAATTPTTKLAATTPTAKPAATTPTAKPAATTPTAKPAATIPTTKPTATTPTTKLAATTPTAKPAATILTTKPTATTPTTKPASTTVAKNPGSTVVGCYADYYPTSRAMADASTTSTSNTPLTCGNYCTSLGFPYSGTEYSDECYCSAAAPKNTSSACNMPCAGDSNQTCGGPNALSVVYTTIPILPATNSTKRGLCWPWNNPASSFALFSPNAIPWLYNWELWDPRANGTYSTAEYVPMSRTQADASQVPGYFIKCYAKHFLGFNEPDLPANQSGNYISPYNASVLWKQYIQPVKKSCNTSLGAPAVTNGVGSGWGTDWLGQFFGNCTSPSCSFDFIPLHWYGTSLSNFQVYVAQFHSLFPTYPLWITEWQFTGVTSTETAYLEKQALQWLDAQSYVARYAMFGPMNSTGMAGIVNGAMVTDGLSALTNVGKIYAGLM